jgi:hypothetical protein
LVRETSTANPEKPVAGSTFEPKDAFPSPLAWTWSDTKGADLSWVPIGFEHSFTLGYSRTHYGTGYFIYHQFVPGIRLSQPIRTWDPNKPLDANAVDLRWPAPARVRGGVEVTRGTAVVLANEASTLQTIDGTSAFIRGIRLSVPARKADDLATVRLRITWDGRAQPSVDAPIPLFFGAGTLYNRNGRE